MIQQWSVYIHLGTDNQSFPLYLQVANEVKRLISSGTLKPGDMLPSSRELSKQLGVSRKTIVTAMDQLTFKGIIENKERVGLFVAFPNAKKNSEYDIKKEDKRGNAILNVDDGCPDSMLLPFKEFSRDYRQFFIRAAQFGYLGYRGPQGYERFRNLVSMVLAHSRSLNVTADEICVTRGSQMALFMVANAILHRGDTVAIEHPGYHGAENVFVNAGLNIIHINVDSQGIITDELEKACKKYDIKAVYVTPRHQYPTTFQMSLPRRKRMGELVQEYDFFVIEDDFGCDFHYVGRMLPPLSCSLPSDKYIYIGTFSKIFAPACRVGYIAATKEVIQKAIAFRALIDIQGDNIAERALSDMLESGVLLRHVKRSIKVYKEKLFYITLKIREDLKDKVFYRKPSGGLAVWIVLHTRKNEKEVKEQLLQRGVSIHTFTTSGNQVGLRIGYASLSLADIDRVIKVISEL